MDKAKAENIVRQAFEDNIEGLEMNPEVMAQTFQQTEIDSLDLMLIMMEIQEKSGVKIPYEEVGNLKTPHDIVAFIAE